MRNNYKIGIAVGTMLIAAVVIALTFPYMRADVEPSEPQLEGFIPDVGAVQDVVASSDGTKLHVASNPFGLVTLDISNSQSPKILGSQRPYIGPASHLAVSPDGKTAVVAGTPRGTDIVDISNAELPVVIESIAGTSVDVAIANNIAYVVSQGNVKVVDISSPANPVLVTTLTTPNIATGIAISGNTAVVSDTLFGNVRIIDISNPTVPVIVGSVSLGGLSGKVAITEVNNQKYALVANPSLGKLQIVNINTPSSPQEVGSISTGSTLDVVANGPIAYVAANGISMVIVDISNPSNPTELSSYGNSGRAIAVSGNTAFIAQASAGLGLVDISNPRSPSTITNIASSSSSSHLAVSPDGKTAVLTGTPRGTDIVDISTPEFPKILTSIAGTSVDVAIANNIAYIASQGNVKVIDISNPASPVLITILTTPNIATGIAISGNTAVVSDTLFGNVRIVDISNPSIPTIVGSVSLGGLSGKVAITKVDDQEYALVANPSLGKLQIVNINIPSSPQEVGSISTGSTLDVAANGSVAYVAANGISMVIVDISNPSNPTELSRYGNSGRAIAVSGNTAFIAQASAGLALADISNPSSPTKLFTVSTLGDANDIVVLNNKIYVASGTAEIEIYNIDKGYEDTTPPSIPDNFRSSGKTDTAIYLAWNASTDDIGVVGYKIYRNNVVVADITTGLFHSDRNLSPNTQYTYNVSAYDLAGNESAKSTPLNVTTENVPDTEKPSTPQNISSSNQTDTTITLEWDLSTDNVGVIGYRIYRLSPFESRFSLIDEIESQTLYTDSELIPTAQYGYGVYAYDAAQNISKSSSILYVHTKEAPGDYFGKPASPQNLNATNITTSSITLVWDNPPDNDLAGYIIYCQGEGPYYYIGGNYTKPSESITHIFEGRKPNTTYQVEVSAFDTAANESDRSQPLVVTTLSTAEPRSDSVQVSTISGQLVDEKTAQPIAGATVTIIDKDNQAVSRATTDDQGKYELYLEPQEGKFTFQATKDNYIYTKKNIDISQQQDQIVDAPIKKSNWFVAWFKKITNRVSGFFKRIF